MSSGVDRHNSHVNPQDLFTQEYINYNPQKEAFVSITAWALKTLYQQQNSNPQDFKPITKFLITLGFLGTALLGVVETISRIAITAFAGLAAGMCLGKSDRLNAFAKLNGFSIIYTAGMTLHAGTSFFKHINASNEKINFNNLSNQWGLNYLPCNDEVDVSSLIDDCFGL
jgi:hypothetical protein